MTPFRRHNPPASAPTDFQPVQFRVERFEALHRRHSPGLLGLSVHVPFELPAGARPTLVVERAAVERAFPPRLASTCRLPPLDGEQWLWRGVFSIPPHFASDPRAQFALWLHDEPLLTLPAPSECRFGAPEPGKGAISGRTWRYAVRRTALLFVVTCQLLVLPGWVAGGALADGASVTETSVEPAPETPTAPPAGEPTEPAPETPSQPPAGEPSEPAPETPSQPPTGSPGEEAPQTPPAPVGPSPSEPAPVTPSQPPAGGSGGSAADATTPSPAPGTSGTEQSSVPADAGSAVSPARRTAAGPPRHQRAVDHAPAKTHHNSVHPQQAPGASSHPAADPSALAAPGLAEIGPILSGLPSGLAGLEANEPPAYLIAIYKAAGHRYDVPWRVLAAINEIETNYGNNLSVSPAGAVGWMQFMPGTWRQWAVDADHDGQLNPYSPQDAIFTAARYLQASGASRDLPGAIFAYNHADWYVAEVLLRAKVLGDTATFARVEKGYSLPLDARYMQQLGRTDDGVDIETAPDGALVYSITPGIVSAVASDPAGFGPNYPVIEATSGALVGQHIYYGHVAESLVQPGQRVAAGQPIAIMGHTGDALSLGHGHIEIGFSDAGGDPLSHHAAQAWTLAGDVMRSFLVTLSGQFGIHNS